SSTETGASFSPNGQWVGYATTEQGTSNLFVQPFPAGSRYVLVKARTTSPHHPVWSPDGSALTYIPLPGMIARVGVSTQPTVSFGNPESVTRVFPGGAPGSGRGFALLPG